MGNSHVGGVTLYSGVPLGEGGESIVDRAKEGIARQVKQRFKSSLGLKEQLETKWGKMSPYREEINLPLCWKGQYE